MLAQQSSSRVAVDRAGRARTAVRCAASAAPATPMKVVVTGAGGRTGKLVVKKLLARGQQFSEVRAALRSKKGASDLVAAGLPESGVLEVDIAAGATPALAAALAGADALVIATSAVPQIVWWSLPKVFLGKLLKQDPAPRPEFSWKAGQAPELVDWLGQKAQIDAAKASGSVKHVVLISSMGGTQPDNMLNKIADGNILAWKRKAEQYLVASGLPYTILHPGGLIDEAGGKRELVLGVDDELLKRKVRSIPRADVAELAVQALLQPAAVNRALDAISLPPGEGAVTSDFGALYAGLKGDCDYSIHSQMVAGEAAAAVAPAKAGAAAAP